jgi:ribosome maturation factor RimP
MRYSAKNEQNAENLALQKALEEVLLGLKYKLIELVVSRHRGSVHVKAVIFNGGSIGVDDCSKVHRAITPRLELAFGGQDLYLEVSSPGVERLIKDGKEFAHYTGMGVRCYRTDISDWTAGILKFAGEEGIEILTKDGVISLAFDVIAKAKLDGSAACTPQEE